MLAYQQDLRSTIDAARLNTEFVDKATEQLPLGRGKIDMRLSLAGGACIILIATSCITLEEMAPSVGPRFSIGGRSAASLAVLEQGREVYITDCTRCHSVEPINRYTSDHWRKILERMGPQSKLDESRSSALQAYILAAHTVLTAENEVN